MDHQKGIFFAIFTAILWGFLPIGLKVATTYIDPVTIVWFRFLTASVILIAIFALRRPGYLSIFKKPPWMLLVAAFALGLNYIGFMQGINHTTPGIAQVFMQVGPICLAVIGVLVFKEKLTRLQITGFIIAGAGLFLFYQDQIGQMVSSRLNLGILWVVLGFSTWVVYATFQKILVNKFNPQQLNLIIYSIPVLMYIWMVDFEAFTQLAPWQWLLLIALGVNTLLAYGSLAMAFKFTEANKISIIITLNPMVTFLAAEVFLWFGASWITPENVSIYGYLGASFVLGGAVLAVQRKRK